MSGVVAFLHGNEDMKEPILYRGCGVDNIYLLSGYEIVETAEGQGIKIKHQDELHDAIAKEIAENRKMISGKELRFLRKHMDLTQSEVARFLGVDKQSVARWEKDECRCPGPAERLMRLLSLEQHCHPRPLSELLSSLDETDASSDERVLLSESDEGWVAKAA